MCLGGQKMKNLELQKIKKWGSKKQSKGSLKNDAVFEACAPWGALASEPRSFARAQFCGGLRGGKWPLGKKWRNFFPSLSLSSSPLCIRLSLCTSSPRSLLSLFSTSSFFFPSLSLRSPLSPARSGARGGPQSRFRPSRASSTNFFGIGNFAPKHIFFHSHFSFGHT